MKIMLMFRRVLLAKKKDSYTRMDAVQFKVFLGCCLALTVAFSWGKIWGRI